ncbi:MAG: M42 family metallopeptidase [Limisphaerales bacterium]|jgi:putative aminopeptidase FrvX
MKKDALQFLTQLVNTPSPFGHEVRGQRIWLERVRPMADETWSDAYGNTVAVINKGGSPRIMLAAHADEIALAVNYIDEHGFIYVRKLGGVDATVSKAQRVIVHTSKGPVTGVIGNVAPHLSKLDNHDRKPQIHDLFVDIGVGSRKEAQALVNIGNPITIDRDFQMLRNDLAVARAFDNRVGTFAVAEALRLLHRERKKLKAEVCVVSNVMEEGGCLGARQIAYELKPDVAIVTDVTHATDYPTVNKAIHGDVRMGLGPSLTHGGPNHPVVVERLERIASKLKIPVQHEAVSSTSGTDTDVIFWTRGGIPSALISVPNRYMHSPVEMIHLKDLEKVPQLMAGFALSAKPSDSYKVSI